jgi:hypothetical protein
VPGARERCLGPLLGPLPWHSAATGGHHGTRGEGRGMPLRPATLTAPSSELLCRLCERWTQKQLGMAPIPLRGDPEMVKKVSPRWDLLTFMAKLVGQEKDVEELDRRS